MEFTALPVLVQLGIGQQLIRVNFDLIGAKILPHPREVFAVTLRSGTQQVGHPMQNDLEPRRAKQCRSFTGAFHVVSALVDFQNMVIKTLRAHLHLGHTEMAQPLNLIGIDLIGAGLDHQAYIAMQRRFIDGLSLRQFNIRI